jgi:hypothetical protein
VLRIAERFSDDAIFLALASLNTPRLRSSASLSRVTRCDQRFGVALRADGLRDVVRRDVVFLRGAMVISLSRKRKTPPRHRRSQAVMGTAAFPERYLFVAGKDCRIRA